MHDIKAAIEILDHIVIKRPRPRKYSRQNLCLDKGYDFAKIQREVVKEGMYHMFIIKAEENDILERKDGGL